MKTPLLAIAVLAALSASAAENMLLFQTQNEGFEAVPAPGAVAIDGDLADWDLSGRIWSFGDTSVRDSHSVRTAAMWDAQNLYLSFEWRDPTPMTSRVNPAFDPGRGWVSDAVQLRMLVGDRAFWATAWLYDRRVPTLTFDAMDAADLWNPRFLEQLVLFDEAGGPELGEGFASAYREAPDGRGYVHELRIPWCKLGVAAPAAGFTMRLGLEFLWGPASGDTYPSHRYADNMQPGKLSREFYWTAKDAWGDLALRDSPVPAPRRYLPGTPVTQGAIEIPVDLPAGTASFTLAIDDASGRRVRNLVGGADPALYETSVQDAAPAPGPSPASATNRAVAGQIWPAHFVRWDGLDDAGRPVPAGTYTLRTLALGRPLHGVYERCFYNPGTPPWSTADHTGAWAADHAVIRHLAATADGGVVAWCDFAEGGAGAIGIGPDGHKRWGDVRGAACAAVGGRFAYSIPNDWNAMGTHLLRLDAATGAPAPFVRDGAELPMPLPLSLLFATNEPPRIAALAASPDRFVLVTESGDVHVFDAATAALRRIHPRALPFGAKAVALRGNVLWHLSAPGLFALDLDTGDETETPRFDSASIGQAASIAFDSAGSLYVLDAGPDRQVKKFAPVREAGSVPEASASGFIFERAFGKRGGRPGQGHFEPDGLYAPTGLAVANDGAVWVAECSRRPRRVSVWNPDGTLRRDYVGNTGYSASGTGLHDSDPTRAFAEGNEIAFGPGGPRDWRVTELMQTPDLSLVGSPEADPPPELGDNGHMFFSSASGERREYFVAPGGWGGGLVVLLRDPATGSWRTVSALCNVAEIQRAYGGDYGAQIVAGARGQFADRDPADLVLWTDRNGDQLIQRAECEIAPALRPTDYGPGTRAGNGAPSLPLFGGKGWYRRVRPEDFSFYCDGTPNKPGTWRVAPVSFTDDGAPVWSADGGWTRVALPEGWSLIESTPVPGSDLVLAFAHLREPASDWVIGFDGRTGAIRWRYPSPYHGVHGSHDAPMARPGLLIGCLRICGTVPADGDAPALFMIRGNLGEDYWLTQDGLFVSSFFRDGRLPTPPLPDTEEALLDQPMEGFSGGSEHFCGWAGRQDDGAVRTSCGLSREAGMVVRIEGLDTARELPPVPFALSETDVARAAADRVARDSSASSSTPRRLSIPHAPSSTDRAVAGHTWPAAFTLFREGQPERASVSLSWDDAGLHVRFDVSDPLSPWKNGVADPTLLFKGGDALDVRLSRDSATPGVRYVAAPFQGAPYVLAMRETAPSAPAERRRVYSSPVATIAFDDVGPASETVRLAVETSAEGYTATLDVPWDELGLTSPPAPGTELRGDFGLLSSDASGRSTASRVFWSAPGGNLVSDIPSEASLRPENWGDLVLDDSESQRRDTPSP